MPFLRRSCRVFPAKIKQDRCHAVAFLPQMQTAERAELFQALAAVTAGSTVAFSERTLTSTTISWKSFAAPKYDPDSGMAWLGSRATATRTRSRLPTIALVG